VSKSFPMQMERVLAHVPLLLLLLRRAVDWEEERREEGKEGDRKAAICLRPPALPPSARVCERRRRLRRPRVDKSAEASGDNREGGVVGEDVSVGIRVVFSLPGLTDDARGSRARPSSPARAIAAPE